MNPALRDNPLATREDFKAALEALCRPAMRFLSPGRARLRLGGAAAHYARSTQEMEGVCRLLWGIAPLLATEPDGEWTSDVVAALVHGTDPRHPEYWGEPGDRDQRLVECAAIAYALLVAPAALCAPLGTRERAQLAAYLRVINDARVHDNNWLLFRVLVNLALDRLGAGSEASSVQSELDRVESFYRGDGWYSDGMGGACDYYGAFAIHFYCVLYAVFAADPVRAGRFRQRAVDFARQFAAWFADDGAAIPYGRSLTYRFGQSAFWGALAFAGITPPSPGTTKGLLLRNVRWWLRRPVFSETGLLTVGYGYASYAIGENYTSLTSPYWALKAFLPLALPDTSEFWKAAEQPHPHVSATDVQARAGVIVCRHAGHLFALTGGNGPTVAVRNAPAKYAKFCYSAQFGFGIPSAAEPLGACAHDSMLALSVDGAYFRGRAVDHATEVHADCLVSDWQPYDDMFVTTWLVPAAPWHVRVHRIRSARPLTAAEGGFALPIDDDETTADSLPGCGASLVGARSRLGASLLVGLGDDSRRLDIVRADTNTNVLHRRTVIPMLIGMYAPGEHWLACAVCATPAADGTPPEDLLMNAPTASVDGDRVIVRDARGVEVCASVVPDHVAAVAVHSP